MQIPASLLPAVILGGLWVFLFRRHNEPDPWIMGLLFGAMLLGTLTVLREYVPPMLQMILLPMMTVESLLREHASALGLRFTVADLSFSSVPFYGLLFGAIRNRITVLIALLLVPILLTLTWVGILNL